MIIMDIKKVETYKKKFDVIVHKDDVNDEIEYWYGRELMEIPGYERWENFFKVIERAIESCKSSKIEVSDHFREVTKMVSLGSRAKRKVRDYMLTRYACYLIAQNGDPRKEEIAFAQGYFAILQYAI